MRTAPVPSGLSAATDHLSAVLPQDAVGLIHTHRVNATVPGMRYDRHSNRTARHTSLLEARRQEGPVLKTTPRNLYNIFLRFRVLQCV
jgi:hypothetical protein